MAVTPVAKPNVLTDPGFLFAAPLASTEPTYTVAGGKFTDAWPVAWVPLGATAEGSSFTYSTKVEAISVAEFFDPIKYVTTERSGNITFAMADVTLARFKMALNGGVGTLTAISGTGATALYQYEPVDPGNEVRIMIGWESLDSTLRLVLRQTIQGGDVTLDFKKAPDNTTIPTTFNLEIPGTGVKPFQMSSTRG